MSTIEDILDELLEEAAPIEEGSGVFIKQLRNGPLYTCKCPECGTFHGGFRDKKEAFHNLKCRRCYGHEIEKKKKDIEKVDEPEKERDLFKQPMRKPAMAEALEDEDFKDITIPSTSFKAKGVDLSNTIWNDEQKLRLAFSWLTRVGVGPKFGSVPIGWYQQDMAAAIDEIQLMANYYGINPSLVRYRSPYIFGWSDKKERWAIICTPNQLNDSIRRVRDQRRPRMESSDFDDFNDFKEVAVPGAVDKNACLDAYMGQQFWETATGRCFRVIGRCKTWKTRPNEYSLPVKFGLFQTFHINERNAGRFTSIRPDNATSW